MVSGVIRVVYNDGTIIRHYEITTPCGTSPVAAFAENEIALGVRMLELKKDEGEVQ